MMKSSQYPGGIESLFSKDWPPEVKRLIVQMGIAYREQSCRHAEYEKELATLHELARQCAGIACPKVREAGQALAKAPRGGIHAPFTAFADALLARSHESLGAAEEQAVLLLANQSMWQMKKLAQLVQREQVAQERAMRCKAQAQRLLEAGQNGTGGLH
ncbi:hypothetical protein [Halomonas sp. E14]|uniref:hypothetical protein n=1 Tax=Halomonas sp. E14 TaxID=3397245 RepID=UPI00403EA526